ncbi:ubiquitin-like-specific protease ESD4 isoform X2 [Rhododendron vialii]|uniref:ubiquitin-like-specific protease ESD4 isoform X2 n=1 Tax=Rhododendron vialii TaxID=182163 RepID=UPI00265F9A2F|nr:ubiquitin-like-specific protease ESD4 isoform X2 [Rhododendron vialii]
MGALTSNHRSGDGYLFFPFNSRFFSTSPNSDTHIAKKPKTSPSSMQSSPEHSRSAASRVYRYPDPVNPIPRAVHAPCRESRFSFCSSSSSSRESRVEKDEEVIDVDEMGNSLSAKYDKVKKLKESAIESFRYLKKDEEVIDVDGVVDRGYVSGNSSVEEVVEVVCDGREWRLQEENGKVVVVEHRSDLTNTNLMEKRIESLSLDRKWDGPLHKKLLEDAGRHDPILKSLSSDIEINEKKMAAFQLLHPAKKPQHEDVLPDVLREAFVPLTKEEKAEVSLAFSDSSRRKVLATHEDSNIEITGELLKCLRPGAWLNDEVINVYLKLLKEREKREPKKFLKCHFFNTFFYRKLIGGRNGYDFRSVKRWTSKRKLGYCLLECDKIFVPIHKETHWCLAVINKKDEKFQYLDSLKGIDTQVLKARYFVDEVKDKSGKDIDVRSWKQENVEDLPEQKNGSDCGMFMIKYADFYSRDIGLHFKQEDMPYFRQRTAKEILRLKAE